MNGQQEKEQYSGVRRDQEIRTISDVDDIVDAIIFLTEARHVTGEVPHVDAGAHKGKW